MASLKDLRNRIASVKATQKITKAMQMVAAAKLRRAQSAAEAARPYAERMGEVMTNLAAPMIGQPGAPVLLAGNGKDQVHLLVVCTADRGLCGGFNSSIARFARAHANKLMAEGKEVKFFCVGQKGYDVLRRLFPNQIVEFVSMRAVRKMSYGEAEAVSQKVQDMFAAGDFDVATLFFAKFKSVISQIPTSHQLIPAQVETSEESNTAYEFEPEESEILEDILPRNLTVQIFSALLENVAGEMGAKMSAMDNATRNAGEMIKKLEITYNRQRQAQITKELIEIISGAEAL